MGILFSQTKNENTNIDSHPNVDSNPNVDSVSNVNVNVCEKEIKKEEVLKKDIENDVEEIISSNNIIIEQVKKDEKISK